ncbi:MAG: rhs element Vgr protein [Chloroflexi bacterium HGW-Chloroflexi-9]|nr:MAG: rhs element Vgr protein [Chloroflexi bacterium HGW-Chloroflexi-9]
MVTESIAAYQVKAGGSAISEAVEGKLAFIRVEESLSLPSSFTLRFTDPDFSLLDATTFDVGTEVEISFGWGTSLTTVMRGEVTGLSVEASEFAGYQLEVFGLDKMHRTMRGTKSRTFQNQSDSDVATKIAQEAGLTADVESTGGPHPFLFQVNETDHQFLRKRARRIGFDFWVSDGKLHFKRAAKAAPTTVTWGQDLYRFKARMSAAGHAGTVNVRGWDDATQQAVVGNGTANPNDPSDATFYTGALTAANSKFGGAKTLTASGVPVGDQSDATNVAKGIRQRLSSQGLLVRGEVDGDPALGAGSTLQVAGLGTKLSGQYLVTATEHILGAGQPYVTRWVSSGPEPAGLSDLIASAVDATGQIRSGVHIAVGKVTNNNDPDGAGRVKVKMPALDAASETGWVRVASPGAGNQRGFQMLPAVNDEVLVGFEYGDASRPFVLGSLWSKKDKPPEGTFHNSGVVEKQMWRSGKGHEFSITDTGDGELVMKLKSGDSSLTITKDLVTLKGKTKVKVESDEIEVAATGKLTLKGRQVEVNGSQDVTIKGGMIKLN